MVRPINGASTPLSSSRIAKSTVPSTCGVNVNVRTPLKRPRGKPPSQVMRRDGSNCETVAGNARPLVIIVGEPQSRRRGAIPSKGLPEALSDGITIEGQHRVFDEPHVRTVAPH